MAQINIQRKRKRLWPWLVAALAVALLFWLLLRIFGEVKDPGELEPVSTGQTSGKAALPVHDS